MEKQNLASVKLAGIGVFSSSFIIIIISFFFFIPTNAQNVGIDVDPPLSKLHTNGGILSTGTIGSTPLSGAGTRLMWIPEKKAFRLGTVTGVQWDNSNIGDYSAALGLDVSASGTYSFVTGNYSSASGFGAVALGDHASASGDYSYCLGHLSSAPGLGAITLGYGSVAHGDYSISMGNNSYAESFGEFVIGRYNIHSLGNANTWVSTDPLFIIGNGTDFMNENNAFIVYKNGNTEIGGNLDIAGTINGDGSGLTMTGH
jgi:hypothetical protein